MISDLVAPVCKVAESNRVPPSALEWLIGTHEPVINSDLVFLRPKLVLVSPEVTDPQSAATNRPKKRGQNRVLRTSMRSLTLLLLALAGYSFPEAELSSSPQGRRAVGAFRSLVV
ncbi:hypothetical protein [Bradyrhizobium zhanjiangense]|uniref:hypothetical protein n=1 Tax=Bradyrhizobium zhanjiangense TaxID=1325107 RepID=UPI001008CE0E|nr:hypothetical protein [Bradyrhizobium zhanjiangense]